MIEENQLLPDICCPLADRIVDVRTKEGCHVDDLHRHKGLFKGIVREGEHNRTIFWLIPNGRLTLAAETNLDLRKIR